MAENLAKWPSRRGPIFKTRPSDGCRRGAVPLAVERWYDFHGFRCHLGNVGWGNKRLDPGRVGILMMSEVLVTALTAALLTVEPFGWRQIVGGGLIVAAAAIDIMARAPEPALSSEPAA